MKLEQPILIILVFEIKVGILYCFDSTVLVGSWMNPQKILLVLAHFELCYEMRFESIKFEHASRKKKVLLNVRFFRPLKVRGGQIFLGRGWAFERGMLIWNLLHIYYVERIFKYSIKKGVKKAVVHMVIVNGDLRPHQNYREYGLFFSNISVYYIGVINFILSPHDLLEVETKTTLLLSWNRIREAKILSVPFPV